LNSRRRFFSILSTLPEAPVLTGTLETELQFPVANGATEHPLAFEGLGSELYELSPMLDVLRLDGDTRHLRRTRSHMSYPSAS
jgi:hypothetical protein